VALYVASLPTSIILQSSAGSLKRIINGSTEILVLGFQFQLFLDFGFTQLPGAMAKTWLALDQNLFSRHCQVNAKTIRTPFPVVTVWDFNRYATSHDPVIKRVELRSFGTDPFLDRFRAVHVSECDLHRQSHGYDSFLTEYFPCTYGERLGSLLLILQRT
jgi:hypothetical protein